MYYFIVAVVPILPLLFLSSTSTTAHTPLQSFWRLLTF